MEIEFDKVHVRVKPYSHSEVVPKVIPTATIRHYEGGTWWTYVYYIYCQDQYLRAANYTDHTPNYLDGMVGCDKLRDFRKYYKLEE